MDALYKLTNGEAVTYSHYSEADVPNDTATGFHSGFTDKDGIKVMFDKPTVSAGIEEMTNADGFTISQVPFESEEFTANTFV